MPYNGSGTYVRPAGQPVSAGSVALDTTFNTYTADVATALTNCVTRDGQSPATANIPMGGNKLTGLAAATVAGDALRFEEIAIITAAYVAADVVVTNAYIAADALKANIASPTFTGAPAAPTAVRGTNTTQLATTEFVDSAIAPSNVAVSTTGGTTTLSTAQNLGTSFEISGALTSNAIIVVPNTMAIKSFENLTTGAFTVTIKTAAGTGSLVESGAKITMYANGTNAESLAGFCYGQKWQNFTASRSIGTTYTNTTGKPISISVWCWNGSNVGGLWSVTIDGVLAGYSCQAYAANAAQGFIITIPVGATYLVSNVSAASPVTVWSELR